MVCGLGGAAGEKTVRSQFGWFAAWGQVCERLCSAHSCTRAQKDARTRSAFITPDHLSRPCDIRAQR
ncbi:hypothetical protein HMPREF3192_00804 [Atopobium deltae]|uniref:Uncharacterized protein n=1 Tax=Atopobium deltae TaxID=1393034 RepID=A0A133XUS9_9ACTN|nr:hypothetical protein HMPREF3192_00804 [Atopobium deltae]